MYGQSRDQGCDASIGSPTEPAFFPTPAPVPSSNRSGSGQINKPAAHRASGMKSEVPEVGSMLLAVYETAEEYRAGILLVEAAEVRARDCGDCSRGTQDSASRVGNWLGRVAELQLEKDHQPGEALQWSEAIDLSSDKILYSEALIYKLKGEHVAACRSSVSRLRSITRMLEMSRGGD